ncbi:chitin binding peritrophin-A domain-containing protein [Thiothrix unzii]|uniref:Chitin binding domain-containing protein n=1 Tax=Thiothrix unzii TaxID=111769 RepID=A0A975F895_9GAMM|nr:chitin binding peritrophin-A domain-containing protein [Thiothrix unzii]QTR52888.1 chitin binding domain-containing protein [Thiothrix unzii]
MRYNLFCFIRRNFALNFLTAITMGTLPVTTVYAGSEQCPSNNEVYVSFPNPDDCGSYYVCDNGVPFYKDCPSGLHFNAETEVCDWPENAKCNVDQDQSKPQQ